MQIIDFEKKGNVVRFYLGENGEQWGDDWDDTPYDCNAGTVYENYVKSTKDMYFQFDDLVLEPCDGTTHCGYTKEDMIKRRIPCIIVVPYSEYKTETLYSDDFYYWLGADKVKRFYFGDEM